MKKVFALLILVLVLVACAPSATQSPDTPGISDSPYAPRDGDELLLRGEIFLDSADVIAMESFPVQYSLLLKGNLPSPCHQLRAVINPADAANSISIELYSVSEPDAVCVAMVQPFEQSIYLGTFSAGHYVIWVNDEQVAEFDV